MNAPSKRKMKLRTKLILLLGAFCIGFYFEPSWFFVPFAWPLTRNDHPALNADAVVLLMGDADTRPARAAHAVLEGYGSRLVMVESQSSPVEDAGLIPTESVLALGMAERAGLGKERMELITGHGRATSTVDEARILVKWSLEQPKPVKRLVVVTSWPHAGRAGWIFDKAMSPRGITVEMLPVESLPYTIHDWWRYESGLLFVFEEYVKWTRYLVKFAGRELPPLDPQ